MKQFCHICALTALPVLFCLPGIADTGSEQVGCAKSAAFLAPLDSADHLKYAPDREVQVVHLALEAKPDFKQKTVQGKAVWTFKPLAKPVQELKLDEVDLDVHSVSSSEKLEGYHVGKDQLVITFAAPIAVGKEASVTIEYAAEPQQGLYFRTPEMGYKEGDTHLFSQGEEIEARHWYPCFDSPNEKFTSEITCSVPEGMTVISNGRLVSEDPDGQGFRVFHWSQEKPHANYLISLVAGYFKRLEDKYKEIPLAFYTPPSEINEASNSFRDTRDMMGFFEQEIGVAYPWPKYFQVCVNDFVAGGMENTSCTTLTDSTLFTDATENIRTSEGLIAHELAHQWFGDLVTCKDWSHIWLNESFATYYQSLYNAHKSGRDTMLYELYGRARQITAMTTNFNPIVRRTYNEPREMFDYLAYPKGGWVLHMLSSDLGHDLYRRCIKTYLERHQYGSVVTEDLRSVIEELSGRSYDQFFNQWLYHGYHPELQASYSWDQTTKQAKLNIKQVQPINPDVLLFNLPLTVRFKGKFGTSDRQIRVTHKEEDFYFPLESVPEIVRLDPEYTLLAKITFAAPEPMLSAQLDDKTDMIGRLLAMEHLADKKNKDAVAQLKKALNTDPFYGARIEASRALRSIHSDEALEALLDSQKQPDARVRRAVVSDLPGFYRDSAFAAASKTTKEERNPDIIAAALRGLAGYSRPEATQTLLTFLRTNSFRNELADAAIAGMKAEDDPANIAPLLDVLSQRETNFTSRGFGQGLETLGYLARNEEKKEPVRKFLVSHINDKKERVQISAITALGVLGDPAAIPVLERFATASKETAQRQPAETAVTTLRAGRKPVDDFKNLRQEVLALEKSHRELRKELDELNKKVAAQGSKSSAMPSKPKTISPKAR
jgi:aminopeptidase N